MTAVQESSKTASAKSKAAKTQMMPGAALLLKVLEAEGVEVIFGYPGGAVLPIYDEIFKSNAIRHILVRHEQAAVHAVYRFVENAHAHY